MPAVPRTGLQIHSNVKRDATLELSLVEVPVPRLGPSFGPRLVEISKLLFEAVSEIFGDGGLDSVPSARNFNVQIGTTALGLCRSPPALCISWLGTAPFAFVGGEPQSRLLSRVELPLDDVDQNGAGNRPSRLKPELAIHRWTSDGIPFPRHSVLPTF